ncbi:unnamed protein product [Protopolystoma xenopodis]|uniref:Uncharacterized protein n=1 Tax=Protopolystoma xenopodis TaxID=117903 RepID=A0A448X7V0_9PLAT|nr:unnamed protein product [Protopolystoma xenopodis]
MIGLSNAATCALLEEVLSESQPRKSGSIPLPVQSDGDAHPSASSHSSSSSNTSSSPLHFIQLIDALYTEFTRLARLYGCASSSPDTFRNSGSAGGCGVAVRAGGGPSGACLDDWLCMSGYPDARLDHARSCVDLGLAMQRYCRLVGLLFASPCPAKHVPWWYAKLFHLQVD